MQPIEGQFMMIRQIRNIPTESKITNRESHIENQLSPRRGLASPSHYSESRQRRDEESRCRSAGYKHRRV